LGLATGRHARIAWAGRRREPGAVRLWSGAQAGHGGTADLRGGDGPQPAGRWPRHDALHPALALVPGRPQCALAPLPPTAPGPLRPLRGGRHAVRPQDAPPRVQLPAAAARAPPRGRRPVMLPVEPRAEPGRPRPPLPARGWRVGPRAEALQLGQRPGPTGSQRRGLAFRPAPGRAEERGHAGLPGLAPTLPRPPSPSLPRPPSPASMRAATASLERRGGLREKATRFLSGGRPS
jgi:hypothetical protein